MWVCCGLITGTKPCARPSALNHVHSLQTPHSGPPRYDTTAQRFSPSHVDFSPSGIGGDPKIEGNFLKFTMFYFRVYAKLIIFDCGVIAEELEGIAYLSRAVDAGEPVWVGTGYIFDLHKRKIVPLAISRWGGSSLGIFYCG